MCCKDDGGSQGGGGGIGIGRPPMLKLVVDNPVSSGQQAAAQPDRAPTDRPRHPVPWGWIVAIVVALLVLRAA